MSAARRQRRGLGGHPFLLFGLLLLVPAVVFGVFGWQSIRREQSLAEHEAVGEAEDVVGRRIDVVAQALANLDARESERPYFHYQLQYTPEETVFQQLDFQATPLEHAPEDPRLVGWFQWELGAKGVPSRPQTFGPWPARARASFVGVYGPGLRRTLAELATRDDPLLGRRVVHPLRVVQANEERGQLIEELQIAQQTAGKEVGGAEGATTPYLKSYFSRVGDDPVGVRYGSFRYLALADGVPGPPLVAWRVVRIPAVFPDRRVVRRERWLLQGFALDPTDTLLAVCTTEGVVRVCRADRADPETLADPRRHEATLPDALDAELVGGEGADARPPAALTLVAVPDNDVLRAAYADSRTRFLLLLAGVVVVVGIGFFVTTRGLRREIALARRKEDFVAAVTHELKTPLAGIRMYADMLREGWVADEASADRYATRIIEESDRLGHLVDQVLDLAALERGVTRANAMPGDLGSAVSEAAALMAARAERAGVSLAVEVEDDLPTVTFDGKFVRPLVLNLLDNAIKYSENAPTKEVRTTLKHEGDEVVLRVADRGVGIDPKVQRDVFEPFHRAGDELTRTSKGVGIGLALVKRYADAHRAPVRVESAVGEGTTVTVRFPR